MITGPIGFDLPVSHALQSFHPTWLIDLMKAVSLISTPEVWAGLAVLVVIWLWYKGRRRASILTFAVTIGAAAIPVLKKLIDRPRPSADLVQLFAHETSGSMPSGHAVGVALLAAGLIWFLYHQKLSKRGLWATLLVLYALLVGYSRVFLGVHWATDVLAGYAVGVAWVVLVDLLVARLWLAKVK